MKKILTFVLVIGMLTTILIGCGTNDDEKEQTTTATKTTTAKTTQSEMTVGSDEMTSEEVDTVTTASIVDNADALIKGLSADGAWLVAALNDIDTSEDIVVAGEFIHREKVDRKLALYTQDDDRKITAQFQLTAPKLIVKSENFRITGGTFKGDVYVEANGFMLDKSSTVDGNIYFTTKEQLDSFTVKDTSVVTGTILVSGVDVVTTASLVTDANQLVNALSADGTWIAAVYNNMIIGEDLIVDGQFMHRDELARKLALYTQDSDRNITASFTLTAPKMIVRSENFKIQGGTFIGDVYVEANGFRISKGTVDGNVYFASQEYMDTMVEDETGTVTGEIAVE